jgi:hypothetical protein
MAAVPRSIPVPLPGKRGEPPNPAAPPPGCREGVPPPLIDGLACPPAASNPQQG